jgi:hypothetical protein
LALAVEEPDGHFPARERGYVNRAFRCISATKSTRMRARPALAALRLGATGVAAAVANAVYDAVGIRIRDLPITSARLLSA